MFDCIGEFVLNAFALCEAAGVWCWTLWLCLVLCGLSCWWYQKSCFLIFGKFTLLNKNIQDHNCTFSYQGEHYIMIYIIYIMNVIQFISNTVVSLVNFVLETCTLKKHRMCMSTRVLSVRSHHLPVWSPGCLRCVVCSVMSVTIVL